MDPLGLGNTTGLSFSNDSTPVFHNLTRFGLLSHSPYSPLQALLIGLVLLTIIIVTIVGNVLVCIAVCIVRKLRRPCNYLLVSLAVSDLCVAILVMPAALLYEVMGKWNFGFMMCNLWVSFDVLSCTASILNLCMISVDRYYAITKPLEYGVKRTPQRMMLCVVFVWLGAACISLPPLIVLGNDYREAGGAAFCSVCQNYGYQIYATLGSFYIPLTVMITVYYKIFCAARKIVAEERRAQNHIVLEHCYLQIHNDASPAAHSTRGHAHRTSTTSTNTTVLKFLPFLHISGPPPRNPCDVTMRITVSTLSTVFTLDVSPDLELENFKTFCQLESGIPAQEMLILHHDRALVDNRKSLAENGLTDGDMVFVQDIGGDRLQSRTSTIEFLPMTPDDSGGQSANPGPSHSYDPVHIRDLLLADPTQLRLLKENNPPLYTALRSGDLDRFSAVLNLQIEERDRRNRQRTKLMSAHPIDVEAQRLIAEEIRQKNIEANMEAAMEYNPETFGSVVMLYINCKVNGVPVKAFVDSGAQTTIMSASCAERCAIMRLIDTRWAGVAKGVGIQKIIGRIHMVECSGGNTSQIVNTDPSAKPEYAIPIITPSQPACQGFTAKRLFKCFPSRKSNECQCPMLNKNNVASNQLSLETKLRKKMQTNNLQQTTKKLRFQLVKERKASTTLGIIMSAFTVCWLPFFVLALIRPFLSSPEVIPHSISSFFLWLGYANSLLNPVIYATLNRDFRRPFQQILYFKCSSLNHMMREEFYHSQYGDPTHEIRSDHELDPSDLDRHLTDQDQVNNNVNQQPNVNGNGLPGEVDNNESFL